MKRYSLFALAMIFSLALTVPLAVAQDSRKQLKMKLAKAREDYAECDRERLRMQGQRNLLNKDIVIIPQTRKFPQGAKTGKLLEKPVRYINRALLKKQIRSLKQQGKWTPRHDKFIESTNKLTQNERKRASKIVEDKIAECNELKKAMEEAEAALRAFMRPPKFSGPEPIIKERRTTWVDVNKKIICTIGEEKTICTVNSPKSVCTYTFEYNGPRAVDLVAGNTFDMIIDASYKCTPKTSPPEDVPNYGFSVRFRPKGLRGFVWQNQKGWSSNGWCGISLGKDRQGNVTSQSVSQTCTVKLPKDPIPNWEYQVYLEGFGVKEAVLWRVTTPP